MATIFEKLPASGEKCLILEPREALIYPFDLGNWTQLRMSAAVSFTSTTDDNSFITSETVSSSNSPRGSMYWGLYSGGGNLPFSNTSSFVGFGNKTGSSLVIGNANNNGLPTYAALTIDSIFRPATIEAHVLMNGFSSVGNHFSKSGHGLGDVFNLGYFALPSTSPPSVTPSYLVISGEQNYCVIQSTLFNVINKGLPGQSFDLCWSNNGATPYTNVSIDVLKQCNANLNFSSRFTGVYYNSNCSSTGSPVDLPSNIILYFPFTSNRLRVHSILIERF